MISLSIVKASYLRRDVNLQLSTSNKPKTLKHMIINNQFIDTLVNKAKESVRLRHNICLHKSPEESVQKMVSVLLPGTKIPVHRHLYTDETLVVLRGEMIIKLFNDNGEENETYNISPQENLIIDIPKGRWHQVIVSKTTTLVEIKSGPYRPLQPGEYMNNEE